MLPHIGGMGVCDVRQRHLLAILDNLKSANRNRVLAILKELITTLPATAIKRAKKRRSTRAREPRGAMPGWECYPLYAG